MIRQITRHKYHNTLTERRVAVFIHLWCAHGPSKLAWKNLPGIKCEIFECAKPFNMKLRVSYFRLDPTRELCPKYEVKRLRPGPVVHNFSLGCFGAKSEFAPDPFFSPVI